MQEHRSPIAPGNLHASRQPIPTDNLSQDAVANQERGGGFPDLCVANHRMGTPPPPHTSAELPHRTPVLLVSVFPLTTVLVQANMTINTPTVLDNVHYWLVISPEGAEFVVSQSTHSSLLPRRSVYDRRRIQVRVFSTWETWQTLPEASDCFLDAPMRVNHDHVSSLTRQRVPSRMRRVNEISTARQFSALNVKATRQSLRVSRSPLALSPFGHAKYLAYSKPATVSGSIHEAHTFKHTKQVAIHHHKLTNSRGLDGTVVRLLASHQGDPGSIPSGVAPGFSHVGIVPDNAAGRRVFSGLSRFLHLCIPAMLHVQNFSNFSLHHLQRIITLTELSQREPGTESHRRLSASVLPWLDGSSSRTPINVHSRQHLESQSRDSADQPHQGKPCSIPDFRKWESCRTMPLVIGFYWRSPVFPGLSFRCCSILTSFHQDLVVKSHPNLSTLLNSYQDDTRY
ncbi:hypothetical protein PR048_003533 [Dryococelus australis]|uniref:Uncharacterized protein n=1 Tax=Dryococelus australis TaxID=614101 RepID=A0ABQ9INA7_9NEOP|nr:hypothetical protein PR048_003533 [Dryococelus australis]